MHVVKINPQWHLFIDTTVNRHLPVPHPVNKQGGCGHSRRADGRTPLSGRGAAGSRMGTGARCQAVPTATAPAQPLPGARAPRGSVCLQREVFCFTSAVLGDEQRFASQLRFFISLTANEGQHLCFYGPFEHALLAKCQFCTWTDSSVGLFVLTSSRSGCKSFGG